MQTDANKVKHVHTCEAWPGWLIDPLILSLSLFFTHTHAHAHTLSIYNVTMILFRPLNRPDID